MIEVVSCLTDRRPTPIRDGRGSSCDGHTCAWSDRRGRIELFASADEGAVRRFRLIDGEAVITGCIHELVARFTPEMSQTYPLTALGSGMRAAEAVELLSRANGAFVAVVVSGPVFGGEAGENGTGIRAHILGDRYSTRLLYYGETASRRVVSTSPQRVSDQLGLGRKLNDARLVDICMYRNLLDSETLFSGVRRLHSDEMIVLTPGSMKRERRSLDAFVMSEVPVGRPDDPLCHDLGRSLIRRAVSLRTRSRSDEAITLLVSSGSDSRVLMAVAREVGVRDLLGVCIGSRETHDESEMARESAEKLGYPCAAFMEEDLDFRGVLEPFVEQCGYPPKYYNHLPLAAAVARLPRRCGQFWTGDEAYGTASSRIARVHDLTSRPWVPPVSVWRLLVPMLPLLPARVQEPLWIASLDLKEAVAVSLCPETTFRGGRHCLALFGNGGNGLRRVPQYVDGVARLLERHPQMDRGTMKWLWHEVIFGNSVRSRRLLAAVLGARLDYPLKDVVLYALAVGVHAGLPPEYRIGRRWKRELYLPWCPTSEQNGKRKGRLVGSLNRWFADPRKLGDYRDVIASHECLERGVFDRRAVKTLLDRSANLTQGEARLLWMVLTTELLFRTGTLRASNGVDRSGPPTREAPETVLEIERQT